MNTATGAHRVRVYYEDTDHSGAVYHANYLRYMERAREHLLGPDRLVALWEQEHTGFVVYKASLTYREAARFGDILEVRTTVAQESPWRLRFQQDVWRVADDRRLVEGQIELACVGVAGTLTPIPSSVLTELHTHTGEAHRTQDR